jgi:hypothetical protein
VAALVGLMNAAFLRPWQVPEPDMLAIFRARTAVGEAYGEISIAEYRFLRQHSRLLSHVAARRSVAVSVDDGSGQQVRLNSVSVSADYVVAATYPDAAGTTRSFHPQGSSRSDAHGSSRRNHRSNEHCPK